jgi:ESF2/ABP1 family protein
MDPKFGTDSRFPDADKAESSKSGGASVFKSGTHPDNHMRLDIVDDEEDQTEGYETDDPGVNSSEIWDGMDPSGFVGPSEMVVKPLTPEALAAFNAAQERTGVVYISRIPPGMQPPKVRHLMSAYGEIGRVYLQQEGS